jgi:hypothetical protein
MIEDVDYSVVNHDITLLKSGTWQLKWVLSDYPTVYVLSGTFTSTICDFTDSPVVTTVSIDANWDVVFTLPGTIPAAPDCPLDLIVYKPDSTIEFEMYPYGGGIVATLSLDHYFAWHFNGFGIIQGFSDLEYF